MTDIRQRYRKIRYFITGPVWQGRDLKHITQPVSAKPAMLLSSHRVAVYGSAVKLFTGKISPFYGHGFSTFI